MGGVCYEIPVEDHLWLALRSWIHVYVVHSRPFGLAYAGQDFLDLLWGELYAQLAHKGQIFNHTDLLPLGCLGRTKKAKMRVMQKSQFDRFRWAAHGVWHSSQMRQGGKVGGVSLQCLWYSAAHGVAELGLAPLAGIEGVSEWVCDESVVEDEGGYVGVFRSRLCQLPLQKFFCLPYEGHLEIVGE